MAPPVTTILSAARAGARVVRALIAPAQGSAQQPHLGQSVNQFGRDPWLPQSAAQQKLRRGASVTRRGLGLATLMGLSVLGAVVIGTISLLLLIFGVLQGSAAAGWLLAFTLLIGLFGMIWTARRASNLLSPPPAPTVPLADAQAAADGEQGLLTLLHTHERALPASTQGAFRATVIATRDALRVSAGENMLSREAFDARQAAREDLPELMDAYRSVPPTPHSDQQLLEQLSLIEGRMHTVIQQGRAAQERRLSAGRQYLEDKYQPDTEE
ncbi:hypothetical protein D3875_17455 [Deinococcus cavernae]|uniref:Uncharacterized protein n=1 Tax=Deinococcus cavernae TaxID=2320857 RepID=A0A418VAE4_9DEIO|nr:hypothetical protein [Deinococcus cavernae]RJF73063.1 hypothetical protein D3875_17455 [Deinococcus cavernae]